MKTTSAQESDMREEYSFDYQRARPNRFVGQIDESQVVVVLDPDVSEVFTTPSRLTWSLRALITTMPSRPQSKAKRSKSASQSAR